MNLDSKKLKKSVKNFSLGIAIGLVLTCGAKYALKKEPVMQEREVTNDLTDEIRISEAIHYDNGEILFIMHFPDELKPDDEKEEYDLTGASYVEIFGEYGKNEILSVEEYQNLKNNDNAKTLIKK